MAAVDYFNFDTAFFSTFATFHYYRDKGASGKVYGPIPWRGLKLALKEVMFADGKVTDEFKKDIEVKKVIWTSLEHKHLTKIYSVDLHRLPKAMFIVIEWAAGGSLNKTLRSLGPEKKLSIDVVTNWSKQIAEGMLYLHERRMVHRDLKSSNILLMEPFNACNSQTMITLKITDFDEVKKHDHTTTMSFVGTYAYMAPEVLADQWFSKTSDVWSFGVVIWEMLSGDIPHKELQPTRLIQNSISGKPEKLLLEQSFPEDYKLLLNRCWETASRERPSFKEIFCILQRMAQRQDGIETLKTTSRESANFQDTTKESKAIRLNHQFLVKKIKSIRLIDLLHEKYCITDEERHHLKKQASSLYRNDALLQWMTTIPFKGYKGEKILECFRQTEQNFIADLLVKGGVLIKSKISTELVKVGLFTKSSSTNVEELKEKEIRVIERLNQPHGLSLSSIQCATSKFGNIDFVIAPYCHQEADGIVIWFWCQSKHGQKNLQLVHESGVLLGKLITMFEQFSKDTASSTWKILVPTSISMEVGHIENSEQAKVISWCTKQGT